MPSIINSISADAEAFDGLPATVPSNVTTPATASTVNVPGANKAPGQYPPVQVPSGVGPSSNPGKIIPAAREVGASIGELAPSHKTSEGTITVFAAGGSEVGESIGPNVPASGKIDQIPVALGLTQGGLVQPGGLPILNVSTTRIPDQVFGGPGLPITVNGGVS